MSSFTKKTARARALPIGTKPAVHSGQLLTSSGIPSLDALLGGGIAIGSMVLIDEDKHGAYAGLLLKFFLSEGVAAGHHTICGTAEHDPNATLKGLYSTAGSVIETKSDNPTSNKKDETTSKDRVDMEIAWRYNANPKIESEVGGGSKALGKGRMPSLTPYCHTFDVTKTIGERILQSEKVTSIDMRGNGLSAAEKANQPNEAAGELLECYSKLLKKIQDVAEPFAQSVRVPSNTQRGVFRLGLYSLGSPRWPESDRDCFSLVRFVASLKSLMRQSFGVCVLTVKGSLLPTAVLQRLQWLCDTVIGLKAFAGTDLESNAGLKDYHGYFEMRRFPKINSLTCVMPETLDLVFKLRRKNFVIEKLHLPPDLSETVSRSQGVMLSQEAKSSSRKPNHTNIDF
eukprot:m.79263 g.79263  ORF g.79263 m.79263 type:complete len:399 (+) comp12706_c0_seq1:92-1288(+)